VTINLADPVGEVSTETAQRDGHMTALSVAEHIMSTSPVIPTALETRCTPWDVKRLELVLHFYEVPDDVRLFAETFKLTFSKDTRGDGKPVVRADGVVSGVQVRAWSGMPPAVTA
jgi:hypothetical protein